MRSLTLILSAAFVCGLFFASVHAGATEPRHGGSSDVSTVQRGLMQNNRGMSETPHGSMNQEEQHMRPGAPHSKGGMMGSAMMEGCMMQAKVNNHMRLTRAFNDSAYLSAMIAHHEAAVDMAKEVLEKGNDPEVKKWAEEVIATQEKEIASMREWLTGMGGEDPVATQAMQQSLHAMMQSPMSNDPDINFVSMMIEHHAGAVEMAAGAIVGSSNEQVISLSQDIITTQVKEIIAYKQWLAKRE